MSDRIGQPMNSAEWEVIECAKDIEKDTCNRTLAIINLRSALWKMGRIDARRALLAKTQKTAATYQEDAEITLRREEDERRRQESLDRHLAQIREYEHSMKQNAQALAKLLEELAAKDLEDAQKKVEKLKQKAAAYDGYRSVVTGELGGTE